MKRDEDVQQIHFALQSFRISLIPLIVMTPYPILFWAMQHC